MGSSFGLWSARGWCQFEYNVAHALVVMLPFDVEKARKYVYEYLENLDDVG